MELEATEEREERRMGAARDTRGSAIACGRDLGSLDRAANRLHEGVNSRPPALLGIARLLDRIRSRRERSFGLWQGIRVALMTCSTSWQQLLRGNSWRLAHQMAREHWLSSLQDFIFSSLHSEHRGLASLQLLDLRLSRLPWRVVWGAAKPPMGV